MSFELPKNIYMMISVLEQIETLLRQVLTQHTAMAQRTSNGAAKEVRAT